MQIEGEREVESRERERERERRRWPYFDPDYDRTINQRTSPPNVFIDNNTCPKSTCIKVHSTNKTDILLEVVQVLSDLDLNISKAYVTVDGDWLLNVFYVKDQLGKKVTDHRLIAYLQQALDASPNVIPTQVTTCLGRRVGIDTIGQQTVIELVGPDRPGLLSEISAVLASHGCNVVRVELWTHNARVACIICMTDEANKGGPVQDNHKLKTIRNYLIKILNTGENIPSTSPPSVGGRSCGPIRTEFSMGLTHTERRLHQLMFGDRDYEGTSIRENNMGCMAVGPQVSVPQVSVENWSEKGYYIVNIHCKDRPKLLFDIICTLTDMQYVVFHASIKSDGPYATEEYYIRRMDGYTFDTDEERQRLKKCLEASIKRRNSEGTRLELHTNNRIGLLSDITRIFRENGLSITRADVSTQCDKVRDVFYVVDVNGGPSNQKSIEAASNQICDTNSPCKYVPTTNTCMALSPSSTSSSLFSSPSSSPLSSSSSHGLALPLHRQYSWSDRIFKAIFDQYPTN